jgi:hypothetical protein
LSEAECWGLFSAPRRAAHAALALVAAGLAVLACAGRIAPQPPLSPPAWSAVSTVSGTPIVVAARGARTLQRLSFSTRRFSSDSAWAYRGGDSIHVRLRYAQPTSDSTRALIELWGRCTNGSTRCLRGLHELLILGMNTEEAPPR